MTSKTLRRVFKLAREAIGSRDKEEHKRLSRWLDRMMAQSFAKPRYLSSYHCRICGAQGHRKTTCPLELSAIEIQPRCVVEE